MILIGRSLDKFERGSDARLSFVKAPHGIFLRRPDDLPVKSDPQTVRVS